MPTWCCAGDYGWRRRRLRRAGGEFRGLREFRAELFPAGHIHCTDDVPPVDETALNATPIYEAARKMLRDHLRFLDRDHLVSYTVGWEECAGV
jgi:hypothetical protein